MGLIIAISVCNGLLLSVENKLALAANSTTIDATISDNEEVESDENSSGSQGVANAKILIDH
jgi:hypothetical protein